MPISSPTSPLAGRVCVVTGATSGIGRAAAIRIAKEGASVVLIGRRSEAGEALARTINAQTQRSAAWFVKADFSSLAEVAAAGSEIAARYPTIDVLINNAGARNDSYRESRDGIELTFAVNHLAHFLLTLRLLDSLARSRDPRVITVSSGSHRGAKAGGSWNLPQENYDRRQAYARSKLANILFAKELARRHVKSGMTSLAYQPGGVASSFARNNGIASWLRHLLSHALQRNLVTPATAVSPLLDLIRAPASNLTNGGYYGRTGLGQTAALAHDDKLASALWTESLALLKKAEAQHGLDFHVEAAAGSK